jgi:hypothetical protein
MPQDAVSALIWTATKKNIREVLRHSVKLVIDSLADRLAAGEQLTAADVLKLAGPHSVTTGERRKPSFLALLGTLPPYRAEIVARHMLARANRNVGVRKAWGDPQKRKRMSQALLDVDHSKLETRKRLSEASRRSWTDADTRKRRIEGLRYGSQQRSYVITPETSKRLSEAQRRRWADPEKRKRWSEAMRAAWADPEKRERFTEAIRRAWKTPEMKRNHSEGLRRAWAKPANRKQLSERMKRQWAKLAKVPGNGAKPKAQVGAPQKWTADELEKGAALHRKYNSWTRAVKEVRPDEWSKDSKAAANRLRLAVGYRPKGERKPKK